MPTIVCNDGSKLEGDDKEYRQFRNWLQVDSHLSQRISELFWLDMFVGYKRSSLNCAAVLLTIKNLEDGEPDNGTIQASPFFRSPLKGLWYKYYFAQFHSRHNVLENLSERDLDGIFERRKVGSSQIETEAKQLPGETVTTARPVLTNRTENQSLTGDWVIFARSDAGNLYLSLGQQDRGTPSGKRNKLLIDRIKRICLPEFPDALDFLN